MVEEFVVVDVDEKLRTGRVRVVGTSHGNGADGVAWATLGFDLNTLVLDGWSGGFFHVASVIAATLDHEVIDDAVKNQAVVMAVAHISQKILYGVGCFVGVQLNHKLSRAGGEFNLRSGRLCLCKTNGGKSQGQA